MDEPKRTKQNLFEKKEGGITRKAALVEAVAAAAPRATSALLGLLLLEV